MNEFNALSLVYLIGVLALAGSAFASYRMNWQRSVTYMLIWGAIFALAFLLNRPTG